MLTEERLARILELLDKSGSVTVSELMEKLDTSESTIRRDLNYLDREDKLQKVRGGAILKNGTVFNSKDDEVNLRKMRNVDEKNRVAKYAASLIRPGDFVYLDAGTTTECMIDYITERDSTFVTNAVGHAKKLAGLGLHVYLVGGEFKNTTEAIVGEDALYSLRKYNFSKGFFGANGITKREGFTTPELKEAMVKEVAMDHSRERYVLADSSKFGIVSAVRFAEFTDAKILTDCVTRSEYSGCKNIVEVNDQ